MYGCHGEINIEVFDLQFLKMVQYIVDFWEQNKTMKKSFDREGISWEIKSKKIVFLL